MARIKQKSGRPAGTDRKIMRAVSVRAPKAGDTIRVVVASDNPVERYDEDNDVVINEILSMDGVEFRTDSKQLPIVDSHDRSTVRNVLGSVRNLKAENGELVGEAHFAADEESQIARQKLLDGHLTDFSITATPNKIERIKRGDKAEFNGRTIEGPADLVLSWTPTDASLVAAGADPKSTARRALMRSYQIARTKKMDLDTLAKLKDAGMPEEIESAESALRWMVREMMPAKDEDEEIVSEEPTDDEAVDEEETETVERALKAERERRREISSLCESAGISRAVADELIDSGAGLPVVRKQVMQFRSKESRPVGSGSGVQVASEGIDRFKNALRDGLISRALSSVASSPQTITKVWAEKPADGYEDFKFMSLQRMADELLRRGGLDTTRMSTQQIAMVALGHKPTIERMRYSGIIRAGEAYHTTGVFPNLLLDAANKTLLAGYEEAVYTWKMWARQAPSVADFKDIHRIRFSESPDLLMVPETKEYKEGPTSDNKETYRVEKFGRVFTVSWETVVNDDMDAISRIPQMHGAAARRTQNKHVYAVLTDNAVMGDGNALFSSTHSNLDASGSAPSVAELNAAYAAMRTQTGLDGETIINVTPSFLIVPAALEATAYQLLGSIADPSSTTATNEDAARPGFNANTLNIYGPNGPRRLTVVAEPQLDGNSSTAWYLAASNSQIDTVELSFLQGEETPVLENEWDFDTDVYRYKIRQTFGCKAIDWRGLWKNPGT